MGTIRNKLLAVIAAGALSVTALASITPFTENQTDLPQANASGSLKSTTEGGGKGAPPSWFAKLAGKWNEWKAQGSAYLEFSDQPDSDIFNVEVPVEPGRITPPDVPKAPPSGRGNTIGAGSPAGGVPTPGICKCTNWSYKIVDGERVRDKCLDAEKYVDVHRRLSIGYFSPDKVEGAGELCPAPGAWMLTDEEKGIRKELKGNSIIEAFLKFKYGQMGDRDLHQYFTERYPKDFPNRNFKPEVDVQLISVAGAGMTQNPTGIMKCNYDTDTNKEFYDYTEVTADALKSWDGGRYARADLSHFNDGADSKYIAVKRGGDLWGQMDKWWKSHPNYVMASPGCIYKFSIKASATDAGAAGRCVTAVQAWSDQIDGPKTSNNQTRDMLLKKTEFGDRSIDLTPGKNRIHWAKNNDPDPDTSQVMTDFGVPYDKTDEYKNSEFYKNAAKGVGTGFQGESEPKLNYKTGVLGNNADLVWACDNSYFQFGNEGQMKAAAGDFKEGLHKPGDDLGTTPIGTGKYVQDGDGKPVFHQDTETGDMEGALKNMVDSGFLEKADRDMILKGAREKQFGSDTLSKQGGLPQADENGNDGTSYVWSTSSGNENTRISNKNYRSWVWKATTKGMIDGADLDKIEPEDLKKNREIFEKPLVNPLKGYAENVTKADTFFKGLDGIDSVSAGQSSNFGKGGKSDNTITFGRSLQYGITTHRAAANGVPKSGGVDVQSQFIPFPPGAFGRWKGYVWSEVINPIMTIDSDGTAIVNNNLNGEEAKEQYYQTMDLMNTCNFDDSKFYYDSGRKGVGAEIPEKEIVNPRTGLPYAYNMSDCIAVPGVGISGTAVRCESNLSNLKNSTDEKSALIPSRPTLFGNANGFVSDWGQTVGGVKSVKLTATDEKGNAKTRFVDSSGRITMKRDGTPVTLTIAKPVVVASNPQQFLPKATYEVYNKDTGKTRTETRAAQGVYGAVKTQNRWFKRINIA
ncbi:hypothetical protein [Mobiluncus mulieris]|uniref:hypothetical protein n=1 Tax=Mobiluncus mulieris TaxID=2052 RepID=UPI000E002776|nr:hypothetical protein [Mobiluncus mulieris]STY83498.1 Uncharacterised protein [Mobiluncus mulieris]